MIFSRWRCPVVIKLLLFKFRFLLKTLWTSLTCWLKSGDWKFILDKVHSVPALELSTMAFPRSRLSFQSQFAQTSNIYKSRNLATQFAEKETVIGSKAWGEIIFYSCHFQGQELTFSFKVYVHIFVVSTVCLFKVCKWKLIVLFIFPTVWFWVGFFSDFSKRHFRFINMPF